MKLYHGTSAQFLPSIQAQGIRPRGRGRGNWQHTVTSNPRAVYLTTAYPWHFAAVASKESRKGLILEVDAGRLNPARCCPDEDVLEQAMRGKDDVPGNLKQRTLYYRRIAPFNPQHFETSLKHMGTACYYGTVPWDYVTRWAELDWKKMNPQWWLRAVDSSVSLLSYRYLKHYHEGFTRWIFGEEVPADTLFICGEQADAETRGIREKLATDRSGITVHTRES